jgi:hypothetical protein
MRGTTRTTRLFWLLAPVIAVSSVGCGEAPEPARAVQQMDAATAMPDAIAAAPQVMVTPVTSQSLLRGLVLDADNGSPLSGVSVSAAGVTVTSSTDGSFEIPVQTGLLALTASAAGYVDWNRDVPAVGESAALEVRLWRKATEVVISASTTTTVSAGAAAFSVPPGAFPGNVMGSVSYIPPTHIGASPGPVQFQDADERTHRVLGVLNVDLPSTPGIAVTVTAPVPAGTPVERLLLFRLANGAWTDPVAAKSVVGTVASFETTYTGSVAVVERSPADAFVVTSRTSAAATEGDLLMPGTMIAPAELPVSVETPQGDVIEIPAGQPATFAMIDEMVQPTAPATTPRSAPRGITPLAATEPNRPRFPSISLPRPRPAVEGGGFMRGVVRPIRPGVTPPKVEVRGEAGGTVFGARGGVFRYAERPCGDGVIIIVEVTTGAGELAVPGRAPLMLPPGSRLVTCVNCGNNTASAEGVCVAGPMRTDPNTTPSPGGTADAGVGGTRLPVDGAPPSNTGAGGSSGTSAPPPTGCMTGAACAADSVCTGTRASDGSAPMCRCDAGRYICSGGSASSDAGVATRPPIGDAAPPVTEPTEPCGPALMCSEGSICRTQVTRDGTVLTCKCDRGSYVCDTGSGGSVDGGLLPPPPGDAGIATPYTGPCTSGAVCKDSDYCREASADGSTTFCKCDMGALFCSVVAPPPPATDAGADPRSPGGTGGTGGTVTPPPPSSCIPGDRCIEGSICRTEPQPDGTVLVCKCDAGKYACSP